MSRAEINAADLKFTRWRDSARVTGARIWLFRLPSGQVVAALSLDVRCPFIETIDLLEDCYYCDVLVGDEPLEQHVHALAAALGADGSAERAFLSERHQMVFDGDRVGDGCEDLVQRLIYRADLPYRPEFRRNLCRPTQENGTSSSVSRKAAPKIALRPE
ncbi:MAG TPA: hypothetical protein VFQ44_04165 [Streptosporangiaceae bacterium]|nr:hypothetical protein [Streptosporangiaceae bacterium]